MNASVKRSLWWGAAIVLGFAAVGVAVRPPRLLDVLPESAKRIVWKDPDAPRRIRAHAAPIEAIANWPGLGDFLVAVAYIESRGDSQAGSDAHDNAARGWYGIRPESSRATELGLSPYAALKDEAQATALAAWYAERMRKLADPGQVVDWLAIRRGWGLPKDVRAVTHPGYWEQLSMGLKAAGLPASWMLQPAFGPQYSWPGPETALAAAEGRLA